MAGPGRNRRAGLTLTELAIALGAVGLLMAGVWVIVSVVWNNYQGQRLQQQITTVVQNARDYYLNVGTIRDPGTPNPCTTDQNITALFDDDDRRLIPAEMRTTPNVTGGGISHALASLGGSATTGSFQVICRKAGSAFQIKLGGLKREHCVRLLMQYPILMPEMGVTRVITPGGGDVELDLTKVDSPGAGFPMTLNTADTWCNAKENEVSLEFKLRN